MFARFETLRQTDTFYPCPKGRLKLREFGSGPAQLIGYDRPDAAGPKESAYTISSVPDPEAMDAILARAFGRGKVVKKTRLAFLAEGVRVHFDEVKGLGRFIEIEVILSAERDESFGRAEARRLMEALVIGESDLIDRAYADLV